jgi:hypothetical protein
MATCPVCRSEAEEIELGTFDGVWLGCVKVSRTQPRLRRKGAPPDVVTGKNAIERNPFPLGETKNTPNNYSNWMTIACAGSNLPAK